ncbi:MAG: polymerase, beta domain protein region [Holophagaceae bacterium]|nr:polymerase, beta domain protein region [Holophagaceae bacterium]
MHREKVIACLQAHREDMVQFHIRSLSLFGSVARDEARADSDVDLLVEFEGSPSFLDYMDAKFALEEWLGVSVDLVTTTSLKPALRPQVEREAFRVA